jgi:hypothetical protein
MAHKSSKLVTIAFLVLTLVSPMFAQRTPASDEQWSWFGNCGEKKFMGIQIALSGKVIYRSSFPICPIDDHSKDIHKTVVFSMKGGHVFQGEYHTTAAQTIEANIWQAGTDPGAILLGISFCTDNQVLLNTIHIAKPGSTSVSVIDRGLTVRTFPSTRKHLE